MHTFAHGGDPAEILMPQMQHFITQGGTLFAKTKTVFRERNSIFIWKFKPVTTQYIQWTIPSLLFRIRRNETIGPEGLT